MRVRCHAALLGRFRAFWNSAAETRLKGRQAKRREKQDFPGFAWFFEGAGHQSRYRYHKHIFITLIAGSTSAFMGVRPI
jgi:hypothetical protein